MPFNHLFLPDVKGKFIVRWHPLKIVFHEPIDTSNMTMDDLPRLKEQVYNIIKTELLANQHEHRDRKSTRLNSSHLVISYAVFCLKKKNISVYALPVHLPYQGHPLSRPPYQH